MTRLWILFLVNYTTESLKCSAWIKVFDAIVLLRSSVNEDEEMCNQAQEAVTWLMCVLLYNCLHVHTCCCSCCRGAPEYTNS